MATQTKILIMRIDPRLLSMLDAFVPFVPLAYGKKTRSKAVRYILREFLKR
jgi:hypothetical protein